jgi:outer membrane cobalamin receptor
LNCLTILILLLTAQGESYTKVYELGGITVTAKRPPLTSNLIIEINSEELVNKGANTVGDALRFVPGIYPRTGSKSESRVEIFGIEQREIAVLLDGHPIYSPYDGTLDLDHITLDNVSKIEIVLPPVSLLSGPNSPGGVVNIVTKKSEKSVSLGLSEGLNLKSSINYGDKINDFFYYFSGGISRSDGYLLPDGSLRDNSDFLRRKVTGKIGWEPDSKNTIGLSTAYYYSEKGLPLGLSRPRYWRFTDWRWHYVALHGKSEPDDRIKLLGSIYYDKHINTMTYYEDSTFTGIDGVSDYDNHTTGGYTTLSYNLTEFNSLTMGGSYNIDNVKKREDTDPWEKFEGKTMSLSLQDRIIVPSLGLHLEGEIGYDGFRGPDSEIDFINYRTGALFFIESETSISVSFGRKNRFPTLKELYSGTTGNPDLNPEISTSYQLGLNSKYFKFVLFRNDINDLIDRESRDTPFENINWARFQGVSVEGNYKYVRLGYTYLDAYDDSYEILDNRAKHMVNFAFNYSFNFGLNINLDGSWVDRRKDGDIYLDSYTLINANLIQKISNFLSIKLNGYNLLNQWYEDAEGYPLPGRILGAETLINF